MTMRDGVREWCVGGRRVLAWLCLLVLLGGGQRASADEHRTDVDGPDDMDELPEMTLEEFGESIDAGREAVAQQLDDAAAYIDSFFADERHEVDPAEGRLRLGTSVLFEAGETPSLDADVNFNLVLPHTEERLRLVISGGFQRDDDDPERRRRRGIPDDDEDRRIAADLTYSLFDDLQRNLDARIGLRIKRFTPAAAFGLRYRRNWSPGDWTVRMTHQAEWETMDGFEVESFLDFERELGADFFFRLTPEVIWEEEESGFRYGVGSTLTQRLAETRFVQYGLFVRMETEPEHELDEILLRVRYRQTMFRPWIFGEVAPQVRLADAHGLDGTPGVMFRVQFEF